MRGGTAGFSIFEVLVSVGLVLFLSLGTTRITSSTTKSDAIARSRTLLGASAETWMERYRSRQEPLGPMGSACTGSSTAFVCTYQIGHNFASDGIYSHAAAASQLAAANKDIKTVITGTQLKSSTGNQLWNIVVKTNDKRSTLEVVSHVLQ